MSYAAPVRCARPGCEASHPGGRWGDIKAHDAGWFTSRVTNESWCPADVPGWVDGWRARHKQTQQTVEVTDV